MAATADQAAFILSIPKRKLIDETQETLRTSAFPSSHVKVELTHWVAGIYLWTWFLLSWNESPAAFFWWWLTWNCVLSAGKMVEKPLHCINLLWTNCLLVGGGVYIWFIPKILRVKFWEGPFRRCTRVIFTFKWERRFLRSWKVSLVYKCENEIRKKRQKKESEGWKPSDWELEWVLDHY